MVVFRRHRGVRAHCLFVALTYFAPHQVDVLYELWPVIEES